MANKRVRSAAKTKRRNRQEKIGKLRTKFSVAKTQEEKDKILSKLNRINPWLTPELFVAPLVGKK
ncbi:MAG: DUF6800 family protein [Elusimicrobiota bacterium]